LPFTGTRKGAAANFWDIYPDISKADSTAQENMVAQAIRRAQLSQPLQAGGPSLGQEWVRYAQPEIKAATAASKEVAQLGKEYLRYAGEDIAAARSVVVQSAQDWARFAQENYEVVDKALGLTTFAKSVGDFAGEKYAAVDRVLGLTEFGSRLWNRFVGQVVVAKETAKALPHELAHAYGVAERGYEAYHKTRVIDEGATVSGAIQKSLYVGVRYMGERAAGFVKEIGATLVDVGLGLGELQFNATVGVGNRLLGTNARYWTAPDLSASMKAVK
jgi:hypothetical protein